MTKTDELRQAMAAKKTEIENLQKEKKFEDALKAAQEYKALGQELKIEMTLEETTFENFLKHKEQVGTPATPSASDINKLANRAFNKLVLKPIDKFNRLGEVTDDELNAYFNVTGSPGSPGQIGSSDSLGGVLVPQEQMQTIQEFKKDFVQLKNYVSVVSTNVPAGRWATYTPQDLEFLKFAQLADIAESDVTFGEATYLIEDRGLILPISNQLINDANVDIISFMGRQLAEGAVKTENKEIIKPLNKLITGDTATNIAEATTITGYQELNKALLHTLDGAYANAAKIFTNQNGFLWLNNLEDGQNRPLFVPDVTAPNKFYYRGKEIVVVPNSTLPNTTISSKTYAPFFVGDMRSYITFFERQGMELDTSRELYFRKYGTAIRAVIRFGIVVSDPNAMTALKVEVV